MRRSELRRRTDRLPDRQECWLHKICKTFFNTSLVLFGGICPYIRALRADIVLPYYNTYTYYTRHCHNLSRHWRRKAETISFFGGLNKRRLVTVFFLFHSAHNPRPCRCHFAKVTATPHCSGRETHDAVRIFFPVVLILKCEKQSPKGKARIVPLVKCLWE